jgi:hypothetical protein
MLGARAQRALGGGERRQLGRRALVLAAAQAQGRGRERDLVALRAVGIAAQVVVRLAEGLVVAPGRGRRAQPAEGLLGRGRGQRRDVRRVRRGGRRLAEAVGRPARRGVGADRRGGGAEKKGAQDASHAASVRLRSAPCQERGRA